jgi:hypothetical protein
MRSPGLDLDAALEAASAGQGASLLLLLSPLTSSELRKVASSSV